MKLSRIEKILMRNPIRTYFLRKVEAVKVLSNLQLREGSTCIEIGCGQGAGALLINRYIGCDCLICVNIDPEMLKSVKKYISAPPRWAKDIRTDNMEFVCENATKLSFADCYFDAAFLF